MTTTSSTNAASESIRDGARHALREDVKQLKHDVARVKDDVSMAASDMAQNGIEAIQRGAEATLSAGKRVGESAAEAHDALRRHIVQHPTSSILIAAGIGALLARLLPRR